MRFLGDNRDILVQKNVHRIRNGQFKKDVNNLTAKEIKGLDDIVSLDCGEKTELENSSLYKSLRRMTINKDFYKIFVFDQYKDEKGNSLKVYAPQMFGENMENIIAALIANKGDLQEFCSLLSHINKKDKSKGSFDYKDDRNFWWDIENDCFIFFEYTDKVLQAMNVLERRKFGYGKNNAQCALNNMYMELLKKANVASFLNINTTIKDYYFDKEAEIHFIEFWPNATIENIFMEAMVIAKVDKGNVIFNINGILFKINEDSVLNVLLIENGVNLNDKCLNSKKINELVLQYNEELQRKQQELVHILRLVRDKKLHN